ncbi:MarR family transcriptional regulator [Methanospirillum sp.]
MVGDNTSLQLSDGEEEIAEIFNDIGVKRNASRVLVLMIRGFDLTSREIERVCDIRQPEVSIALSDLENRKWVKKVGQKSENKGRPVLIYHLVKSVDDILDELKKVIVGDYNKKLNEIEKVRELLKERVVERN